MRAAWPVNEVGQSASSECQDSSMFVASFFAVMTHSATLVAQLLLLLFCNNSRLFSVPNELRPIVFT